MSLYISNSGLDSNTNDGSLSKPYKTLSYAMSNLTTQDTIIFLKGTYEIPTTDIAIDGITLKSANNQRVIIDGTKNISELIDTNATWSKITHKVSNENGSSVINTNIYKIKIKDNTNIWQLFSNRKEIINARYPSAQWDNDGVYNLANWGHGYYDKSTNGDIPYVNGQIIDYSNNKVDLYNYVKNIKQNIDSDFDLNGVIANLNVGSYKTFTKIISNMNINDTDKTITLSYPTVDLWKTKHHYYYLENHLQFLNSQNEWFFDTNDNYLYVRLTNDVHPDTVQIRAKFQTYAFNIINHNVKIYNFDFFGTTFKGSKNNIDISNCNFLYPSCYARSINKINYDNNNDVFDNTTMIKSGTNCNIHKCSFKYTDGTALEMWGGNNTLSDCYFSYIDKTVANLSSVMTTIRLNGADNLVKNNTFYKTAASSTLNSGDRAIIEYNNLSESGFLQSDGALIHAMVNQQPNIKIRFNWCHDSIKYGIRFDGEGAGHTGYIHHNVVWNCEGGIMVKGGELNSGITVGGHFVYNNTVFNSFDQGKNDIMALNTQGKDSNGDPIDINFGTIVMNNLAERIYGERTNAVDISDNMYAANNFSPTKLEDYINSFTNKDFRPINDNNIINQADTSSTNANTYVEGIYGYNSDVSVKFNPGSGVDKLTSDIGAMNKDDTIWKAGITWNTQSLTGNALDLYITNNYFDFFPTPAVENKKEPDTQNYFSKQKRTSTLNKHHKKIYNRKLFTNGNNIIRHIKYSSLATNNSSGSRLLKIKSAAIYNSKK